MIRALPPTRTPEGWLVNVTAMAIASSADREHGAYIHSLGTPAETTPDGWVTRFGGVVAVVARSPIPLFNHVLIETPEATPDDLRAAVAALEETELRFTVSLRVGIDDRLAEVLQASTLVPVVKPTPGMFLRPPTHSETPSDLEIRSGRDVFDDHCVVSAEGFGMSLETLRGVLTPELADRDDIVFYAGYVGGEPVTSSAGVLHDSSVTVVNVATLPQHRGRGYGGAMTMATVVDGGERGCDAAFLQSSEMGFPVYKRLGFETVVEYDSWTSPTG